MHTKRNITRFIVGRTPHSARRESYIRIRRAPIITPFCSNGKSQRTRAAGRGAILKRMPRRILITLIDGYRLLLSPFFGSQCRFYPTCSSYAREAIVVHGALRGTWLAAKRIVKCGPWHPGGVDPVPPVKR